MAQRGQPPYLGHTVADVDRRHVPLGQHPLEVGQNPLLERLVERGQGLVHHQQLRATQQGPAQRHALLFAARQVARITAEEPSQLEHFDDAGRLDRRRPAAAAMAVQQVALDAQMGKQQLILKHEAHAAQLGTDVDAAARVEPRLAAESNRARAGREQSGDHVEHARLAGARRADQRRHLGIGFEGGIDGKAAGKAVCAMEFKRLHARPASAPAIRRPPAPRPPARPIRPRAATPRPGPLAG